MTPVSLVVMESGSRWPTQMEDLTNVVGLSPEGDDLLERTEAKLDALAKRKQGVQLAVLACNGATSGRETGERASLARALLQAVARTLHGRLILSVGHEPSSQLRRELLSLVGELTAALRGTTASVSVWFPTPAPRQRPATARVEPWALGNGFDALREGVRPQLA